METNISLPGPMIFEGNVSENWRKYRQRFELYLQASEKNAKPDSLKIALLLNQMGDQAVDIYNTFSYAEGENKAHFDTILKKFEEYCHPRKNIVFERFKFFSRSQEEGEPVDKYVTDLKRLANPCEFESQADSLIRDRLVLGIKDKQLQERLLREPDLELHKALNICRANETSKQQVQEIKGVETVNAVKSQTKTMPPQARFEARGSFTRPSTRKCSHCGYQHQYRRCPAYGKTCGNCKGLNHFASECKAKSVRSIQEEQVKEEWEQKETVVLSVRLKKEVNSIEWRQQLTVCNRTVNFKVDTGSEVNIIPHSIYKTFDRAPALKSTSVKLWSYSGHDIQTVGICSAETTMGTKRMVFKYFITSDKSDPILGLEAASSLGLVPKISTITAHSAEEVIEQFEDVFGEGGVVKCNPYHITLDKEAIPTIAAARKVPLTLKTKLKEELDRMVHNGILVAVDEPSEWVHPIVIVSKPDGRVRICMDPRPLNKFIRREHYALPTVENSLAELQGARFFSVLDASAAFLQIPLDEDSSKLCTITTPFGRFHYKTMPYGISSAPEVFQKIINNMFQGIQGIVPYMDDILIHGETMEQHNERLRLVLERARQYNLKFSKKKLQLAKTTVKFLGHTITEQGISVDSSKVEAVKSMKSPSSKQELQRCLGMFTYLAKFIPNLAQVTSPLRQLLSNKVEFAWHHEQEEAFQNLKELVCKAPVLKYYNSTEPLCISVDASSYGLGAVALQKDRPLAYCSTSLTDTQRRYAQIEKELLAVLHGLQRFDLYTFGRDVIVQTDHKPLLAIMNKPIHSISPRLQRMILKSMRYSFRLEYVPGKHLYVADALSRCPNEKCRINTDYMEGKAAAVHTLVCATKSRLNEFKESVKKDATLQEVIKYINQGWPVHKNSIKGEAKKFWDIKEELHQADELIVRGNQLVVPLEQRKKMLLKLHSAHQGITSCQAKAKDALYWPGMLKEIEDMVSKCILCQKYAKSNTKQPLLSHKIPSLPWNKVGMDLAFINGKNFLVMVDYMSKFIVAKQLSSTTSQSVKLAIEETIAYFGIPQEIVTDNGPPFNAQEFRNFLEKYDITQTTSSPYYPRSNGMAERAVQTAKGLIKKAIQSNSSIFSAILEYNSTPKYGLPAPCEMLMGRKLRTNLLCTKTLLIPKYDVTTLQENIRNKQRRQSQHYDHVSKTLSELKPDEPVLVQHGIRDWTPGKVINKCQEPDSYRIRSEDGSMIRRNRIQLRPLRLSELEEARITQPQHFSEAIDFSEGTRSPGQSDEVQQTESAVEVEERERPKREVKTPSYLKDFQLY